MGLGMGAKGSTVPIFAAENSPTSIRGALGESQPLYRGLSGILADRDMPQSCLGSYGQRSVSSWASPPT